MRLLSSAVAAAAAAATAAAAAAAAVNHLPGLGNWLFFGYSPHTHKEGSGSNYFTSSTADLTCT
jgi:hypothetical protein